MQQAIGNLELLKGKLKLKHNKICMENKQIPNRKTRMENKQIPEQKNKNRKQ